MNTNPIEQSAKHPVQSAIEQETACQSLTLEELQEISGGRGHGGRGHGSRGGDGPPARLRRPVPLRTPSAPPRFGR